MYTDLWISGFENREHLDRFLRREIRYLKHFDHKVCLLEKQELWIHVADQLLSRTQIEDIKGEEPLSMSWHWVEGSMARSGNVKAQGRETISVIQLSKAAEWKSKKKILEVLYQTVT